MRSRWHEAQRNHDKRNRADRFEQHGILLRGRHTRWSPHLRCHRFSHSKLLALRR